MMRGKILGKGYAAQDGCPPLPYTLLEPSATRENRDVIARSLARWGATVVEFMGMWGQGVDADFISRARFGTDVLSIVSTNLELGIDSNLLAVDPDDMILGAMVYSIVPPKSGESGKVGTINLVAIDPRFMPGSPFKPQLRGIGTALVAATAQRMLSAGVGTVYLHPLDEAAESFWRSRGFYTCGGGGLLCLRGQSEIKRLVDNCILVPDEGSESCVLCGIRSRPKALRP